jgi:hypothetical protein
MEKPLRKISLTRLAHLPWTECSVPHNGVRKRTGTRRAPEWVAAVGLKNQMKLQWHAPLAMRMLIPQAWNRVPSPSN